MNKHQIRITLHAVDGCVAKHGIEPMRDGLNSLIDDLFTGDEEFNEVIGNPDQYAFRLTEAGHEDDETGRTLCYFDLSIENIGENRAPNLIKTCECLSARLLSDFLQSEDYVEGYSFAASSCFPALKRVRHRLLQQPSAILGGVEEPLFIAPLPDDWKQTSATIADLESGNIQLIVNDDERISFRHIAMIDEARNNDWYAWYVDIAEAENGGVNLGWLFGRNEEHGGWSDDETLDAVPEERQEALMADLDAFIKLVERFFFGKYTVAHCEANHV